MFHLHSLHNGGFNLSGQLGKLIVDLFVLPGNLIRLRDILLLIGIHCRVQHLQKQPPDRFRLFADKRRFRRTFFDDVVRDVLSVVADPFQIRSDFNPGDHFAQIRGHRGKQRQHRLRLIVDFLLQMIDEVIHVD